MLFHSVKHASMEDLKGHHSLLMSIRAIRGIQERTPGHFYYRGKSVIHFHTDNTHIYADIGDRRVIVVEHKYDVITRLLLSYMRSLESHRKGLQT